MAALRHPDTGCPWDLRQTFATVVPYTLEEAYEVADAVARGDMADLRDELGDLLLQVVFHARIAEEDGHFDFGGIVEAITAKLIRRHPHVFGAVGPVAPEAVDALWQEIKAAEKSARPDRVAAPSVLDGVPLAMPSLMRADRLARRAAGVGFAWPDLAGVAAKVEEELAEVRDAAATRAPDGIMEEVGDLLFTVANLARHLDVDPEAALAAANAKFERRFRAVEAGLAAEGRDPSTSDLAEMDRLWNDAKAAEREAGG